MMLGCGTVVRGWQVKYNHIYQNTITVLSRTCLRHRSALKCVHVRHCHTGVQRPSLKTTGGNRLKFEQEYSVDKDTVLFRYENKRYFKMMNIFALSQFFFWSYLSHFAFTTMKSSPITLPPEEKENLPWWRKVDFGRYRTGISTGSFLLGWGTLAICWMYTLRSVRCLVLKKGGKDLLFVTFTPFGRNRIMTVPLNKVSAKQSRMSAKVHLPLKVQGTYLHYILDMQGHFTNTKLFDYSAGLRRSWAK